MTEYSVGVAPQAEKQIMSLPKRSAKRVINSLRKLKSCPRPRGAEKLNQNPRFWRIRAGDYRVIYAIDERARQIVVAVVRHRKEAYRDLEKLKPELLAETLRPFLRLATKPEAPSPLQGMPRS